MTDLGAYAGWLQSRRKELLAELAKTQAAIESVREFEDANAEQLLEQRRPVEETDLEKAERLRIRESRESLQLPAEPEPPPSTDPDPEPERPPPSTLRERIVHVIGRSDRPLTARQISDVLFGRQNASVPSVLSEMVSHSRLWRRKAMDENERHVWHYWRTERFPTKPPPKPDPGPEPPPPGRQNRTG